MAERAGLPLPVLVAEAARKSRVCWLSYEHPGGAVRSRLVWQAWHDDALVVLSGDEGQALEGIGSATAVEVTMRSRDTGGRLVTWVAAVEPVPPDSGRWEDHAHALLAVRLNLPDPAAALAQWRIQGAIVRLTPAPETLDRSPRTLP